MMSAFRAAGLLQIPLTTASRMRRLAATLFSLFPLWSGRGLPPAAVHGPVPHLVVLISVDQLRGDYLLRYRSQWRGVFARMLESGAVFPKARQAHAMTETATGHATLLSGRDPAHNGIVSNRLGVPDREAPVVGGSSTGGASPFRFRGTTLVDWLRQRDSATRFFSVSGKDRGAILPIGRSRGPVFWLQKGRFVSSSYYVERLPDWVTTWNGRRSAESLAGRSWTLLLEPSAYSEPDSEPFEHGGTDGVFAHRVPDDSGKAAADALNYPWMDSITVDFALDAAREYGLGRRQTTDLLAVSLSTTDYVGHEFGPDSRELHDQLLRLDRTLLRFVDSLQALSGGNPPLVILTADHGVTAFPEYSRAQQRPGGRVATEALVNRLAGQLVARGVDSADLSFDSGLLTANLAGLKAAGVDPDSMARVWGAELTRLSGVASYYRPTTLKNARGADAALWRRTLPADFEWLLCSSLRPGYIWADDSSYTTHGTTNPDDQSVPIVFMGPGIRPGIHPDAIETVDIAPTLAWLLGVEPSERLDGHVLKQVSRVPAN